MGVRHARRDDPRILALHGGFRQRGQSEPKNPPSGRGDRRRGASADTSDTHQLRARLDQGHSSSLPAREPGLQEQALNPALPGGSEWSQTISGAPATDDEGAG